jgi:hypothetical protein
LNHSIVLNVKATLQTEMTILQARNLILELFPAFDWSKASYRMGRDPQPQELTIAKGVRQGEDCKNGAGSSAALNYQDALVPYMGGSILGSKDRSATTPRIGWP